MQVVEHVMKKSKIFYSSLKSWKNLLACGFFYQRNFSSLFVPKLC